LVLSKCFNIKVETKPLSDSKQYEIQGNTNNQNQTRDLAEQKPENKLGEVYTAMKCPYFLQFTKCRIKIKLTLLT